MSGGEGQREWERERVLSRLHTQHGAWRGAWSHDPGIVTWTQIKSQVFNKLSHPGAPVQFLRIELVYNKSSRSFFFCFLVYYFIYLILYAFSYILIHYLLPSHPLLFVMGELNCIPPPKFICWNPNHSMWLYLKITALKRLLWLALIQSDRCLYKKRKFGHTHRHQGHVHKRKTMWAHREKAVICDQGERCHKTLTSNTLILDF